MTVFIIKNRWIIIALSLLLGVGFGILIPFAKTDPEIRNYVPSDMDSRLETDKIENEFGVQDMIVILFSDSCILNPESLKQIKQIDHDISRLDGIASRISPFTMKSIKGEEGTMVAERLIKKMPADASDIRILAEDIMSNRFARDIVVSSDTTTASITCTINTNQSESETLSRIDSVINSHSGNSKIITGGLPYIRKHIMKDVRKDGLLLIPLALIIMLLILKLTLREWRTVLMPFSVVLISTVFSMGMIPLLGWKMSIMTLLVPVILVAVANNYGIYLVVRYQEISLKEKAISKYEMVSELLKSLNMPILFSGLTTIAGILGLLTHSIIPARQVGILAATGVAVALVISLLLIPALIYLKGSLAITSERRKINNEVIERLLDGLSGLIVRYPGRILVTSAVITILVSSGILLLRIDTNQENYFPKQHPVRKASEVINRKFGGSQTISVMIEGNIKGAEVMHGIDELTIDMEKQEGVGKVFSISQVVREMSKAIYNRNEPGYDKIPESGDAIAQMFELYNMSGDQDDFKQLMNLDNSKAHILIRLSDPNNNIIENVNNRIDELTVDFPAKVTVGGYAIIMADFAGSVIKGQVSSLLFALVTLLILLSIVFKSIKGGLTGSIPLAVSILILFGFMGLTGIALDAATALLSSIMIGVGVDFTIQYIWCFSSCLRKGLNHSDATVAAIGTIGKSIIINALSVMAGFSALIFSGFMAIRFFGYLVLISIGSCLIGAILIIPAFLMKFRPTFIQNDLTKNLISENMKKRILLTVLLLPLLQVEAQQPDAGDIMNKSREMSLTGSMSAKINLSITEKNGASRLRTISMTTKSFPDGLEKRFIRFMEPTDVRGTAMLVVDNKNASDEMWIYLPALKKTRRIVSSEKGKSFMSSEFSNADMNSPTLSDFINKHLEGSGKNNQWIIESRPVDEDKADEYGYSRKVSYIRTDKYQILKMEFYNFDNELFKTIEIVGIYPLKDGKFIIKDMIANNLVTGRRSEITITNITEGAKVDDSVFSLQNLER